MRRQIRLPDPVDRRGMQAAVLGVACSLEGALGSLECERAGIPVQFIPLLRDGCADTDVDLDTVLETLEFRAP